MTTKQRFAFFAVAILILSTAALIAYVRNRDRSEIFRQMQDQENIRSALIDSALMDTIELSPEGGPHWIIGRKRGESPYSFVRRAVRTVAGEESGGPCWESECEGYGHVKICVACEPSETEAECQARLDELVAAWCEEVPECENCP